MSVQACAINCVAHGPAKHSVPLGKTTADCPLCQAIVHAGAFFAPGPLVVFVPRLWIESVPLTVKLIAYRIAHSRDGLSRAPPR
jgi:hypothetical protein